MKFVAKVAPLLLSIPLLILPMVAFGQGNLSGTGVGTFIRNILTFINGVLVPLVFAIAFLVFIWGMFKAFILGGADEGKQSEGKALMFYAIIGFVVMVSLWGIVNLLASSFGLTDPTINNIPVLPTTR